MHKAKNIYFVLIKKKKRGGLKQYIVPYLKKKILEIPEEKYVLVRFSSV